MAIPPNEDPSQSTPYFEQLLAAGRKQGLPLTELSMGMSHDFEYAIASEPPLSDSEPPFLVPNQITETIHES